MQVQISMDNDSLQAWTMLLANAPVGLTSLTMQGFAEDCAEPVKGVAWLRCVEGLRRLVFVKGYLKVVRVSTTLGP